MANVEQFQAVPQDENSESEAEKVEFSTEVKREMDSSQGGWICRAFKKINPELVPIKINMFIWFGVNQALFTYFPLHMKSIGISIRQVGIIYAFLPISQVVGQLVLGNLADRFQRHRCILVISLITTAVFSTALLFVPSSTDKLSAQISERERLQQVSIESQKIETEEVSIYGLTFYLYFFLRMVYDLVAANNYNLIDMTALVKSKQIEGASFGEQRIWAMISSGIMPALAGLLLDAFTTYPTDESDLSKPVVNFAPLFYLYAGLVLAVALVSFFFFQVSTLPTEESNPDNLETKVYQPESKNTFKVLWTIFKKPKCFVFVLAILTLGIAWGTTKIFIPITMTELGSDRFLVGFCNTISMLVGVPLTLVSAAIFRKIRLLPVFVLSFAVYTIRYVAYAFLQQPAYFLIFEALEGITYHLFWVAAVLYISALTPVSMAATVMALSASVHYCVGTGLGGLIAGNSIASFGHHITYLGYAVACFIGVILMGAFTYYALRADRNDISEVKDDEKDQSLKEI